MIDRRQFVKSSVAAAAALTAGPLSAEDLREKLLGMAKEVMARNLVKTSRGEFHVPSISTYPRFYAWDAGWHIIGQAAFDPEGGIRELQAVFNYMRDDGMVPHEAVVPEKAPRDENLGDDYFDAEGRCRITDPPAFLVGAEVLWNKTKDPRILELLPKMQKCLDYLSGPRDLFGDGLVSIIQGWESGTDMSPVYDQPFGINARDPLAFVKVGQAHHAQVRKCSELGWDLENIKAADYFVFEDLCVNGLTAAGARSVSILYEAAGDAEKAAAARGLAEKMTAAMEKIMWDEKRGFFYPRWSVKRRELQYRTTASSFAALLTGMVDQRKADRMFDEYLLNPKRFATPYMAPFNSEEEMRREINPALKSALWRGRCVWANMSWIAARAAAVYGRKAVARDITRSNAEMVAKAGFREYYHPTTGRGLGARTFNWPVVVLQMIEEHGM